MASAKDIRVAPISAADANDCIRRHHYSGTFVRNSQLHLGVFLGGYLEGAMQFGPSLDKRKLQGLVAGTPWNGFIELNRLAFSDRLPRNSESRALAVAFRMIRAAYPHLQWVVSFADGAQCGDGTIYRAAGFVLTGMRKNNSIWTAPSGETFNNGFAMRNVDHNTRKYEEAQRLLVSPTAATGQAFSRMSLTDNKSTRKQQQAQQIISRTTANKGGHIAAANGASSMRQYKEAGWEPIEGYQLRYLYFLDPTARARLTVPILPFSRIDELGAGMYRGQRRAKQATEAHPASGGGAAPTRALHPARTG